MKKKITMVLITTMTMTMLAACGNTKDTNTNTPTPTIEASSEVAESKEESVAESTSEKKYSVCYGWIAENAPVTNQFIRLDDETWCDNITIYEDYAFYWEGPVGIGKKSLFESTDDLGDVISVYNDDKTYRIMVIPNADTSEIETQAIGEDFHAISNTTITIVYPNGNDEIAKAILDSVEILPIKDAYKKTNELAEITIEIQK